MSIEQDKEELVTLNTTISVVASKTHVIIDRDLINYCKNQHPQSSRLDVLDGVSVLIHCHALQSRIYRSSPTRKSIKNYLTPSFDRKY